MESTDASFKVLPSFNEKFRVQIINEIISEELHKSLKHVVYNSEEAPNLAVELSNTIKHRVQELSLKRYKLIVQVFVGEQTGQGVELGTRTFWDDNTDACASQTFSTVSV
eukprot:Platyproteum_vivax@DN1644_c0_g1_i1.p1